MKRVSTVTAGTYEAMIEGLVEVRTVQYITVKYLLRKQTCHPVKPYRTHCHCHTLSQHNSFLTVFITTPHRDRARGMDGLRGNETPPSSLCQWTVNPCQSHSLVHTEEEEEV